MSLNKRNKKQNEGAQQNDSAQEVQPTDTCTTGNPGCANQQVAIYDTDFCQVGEVLERELQEGTNRIYIKVPQTYEPNSFTLDGVAGPEGSSLKVKSISFRSADSLNLNSILARSEDQIVEVHAGNMEGERWYHPKGKISSFRKTNNGGTEISLISHGTQFVKDGNVVLLTIPAELPLAIELPKLPEGLSEEPTLELEVVASQAGTYRLNTNFRAYSISWSAMHSLVYDPAKNELSAFNTFASIRNSSGLAFEDVEVSLLTGFSRTNDSTLGGSSRSRPMGAKMAALESASFSAPAYDNAEVEAVGETKSFEVPGTVSLSQTTQVPIVTATAVPANREFFANPIDLAWLARLGTSKQDASVRLLLTNSKENKLGTPLPQGSLLINQRDSKGRLRLTGSTNLPYVPAGEAMNIVIGTSQDVKVERKVLDKKEVVSATVPEKTDSSATANADKKQPVFGIQTTTTTYKMQLLVSNFKNETVGVLVNEQLPSTAKLLKDSFKGLTQSSPVELKSGANGSSFTLAVTVKPGKDQAVEITYTVENVEERRVRIDQE